MSDSIFFPFVSLSFDASVCVGDTDEKWFISIRSLFIRLDLCFFLLVQILFTLQLHEFKSVKLKIIYVKPIYTDFLNFDL